jgi:nucleotide-binding universal stress UspA family protein
MLPIRTILHPTDFSDRSAYAFRLACALARDTGARLIVLHVAVPPVVAYGEGYVPVVIEGQIALEVEMPTGGTRPIQTVGPGKLLGWTPLLSQAAMTATARAVQPSRLVAVNAMQAREACARNPSFGVELMRRTALALSRRLHATRLQLLEVFEDELPVMSE